jgi:NitT/TauT family transport system permease protein
MKPNRLVAYVAAAAALLVGWKLIAAVVAQGVLPPPEAALPAFARALWGGEFWGHFGASALRAGGAMVLAFGAAFPLGVLMGAFPRLDAWLAPLVFLTFPVPKIVLLPVFLILLGLGDAPKVVMIGLITAYQILVTTRDGARSVERGYVDSVRSLGAGRLEVLREVHLPAALPHGFTAMRLGTGASVAVLFFVESFATTRGLGYLIMDAWGAFDYERMFVGILGMSLLGVVLYETVNLAERRLCRWRRA